MVWPLFSFVNHLTQKQGGSNSRKHCTDGVSVQLTFSEAPGFTVISKSRLANSNITVDVQLVKNRKKAHL